MVALNPVYTIGFQIRETLQVHDLARGAAADRRTLELLEAVRVPDPQRRGKRVSAPAQRWLETTRDDRAARSPQIRPC
jgi:ABC-type microcin C transport system duplicated ATPase subunit YejF